MSWIQKPKYPVKEQLPRIEHHEKLPYGTVELARTTDPNEGDTVVFVQQRDHLSILKADSWLRKNGTLKYRCSQADFPLGVLPWFADALTEFRKPPAQGGLHAGAMTSADEDVEGEMLCIQRSMSAGRGVGGYAIVNRSRKSRLVSRAEHFSPQEITFADNFLYDAGLLDLIKGLGEKHRRGEL
ncbi:hypothetical protein ACONUD_05345 [Microbulbifer harenosus]|uniref:RES domain-containing protein n=1 Tax=Microbulbifer harenosus TaxID=2576840 RepID=A0ABY2UFV6_9GAMM|nr:hypothetical protein [Microbulbifer harenosus]TLM76387.1 hypothetical protein FDY93_13470 [Microbulbifer harenosus]